MTISGLRSLLAIETTVRTKVPIVRINRPSEPAQETFLFSRSFRSRLLRIRLCNESGGIK
jgi:hypothetical protein